ncbi:MAG: argininosuccinate lyase [Kiritimatiellae bacterium]|nr:argininosuccinate lyase [Kiritimatiellia bacterium]
MKARTKKTTVGVIDAEVLAFTAGKDAVLDLALVEADCIGTAAHVTMLSRLPVEPRLITKAECAKVISALVAILRSARKGAFRITLADQDVHLAVERTLTARLGAVGKKVHTGRSRNDQVAADLRLYAKEQIFGAVSEAAALAQALVGFARKHAADPMVGRTHMQPAMPSSVGLWAAAHAESLLEDIVLLKGALEINDQSPLGSAAGYGVPLPLDRQMVSDLLGFERPCHNVLYAGNARGKVEAIVLSAMSQVMLTLSRLAQDLILFSMPEFGYFRLAPEHGTGSSIMPQKNNPDVLELVRAKAAAVMGNFVSVFETVRGLPSGYNRDLQETKAAFMEGLDTTRASLRIMRRLIRGLGVDRQALQLGFTPDVFAADQALRLVAGGKPFREAYRHVKEHLDDLRVQEPRRAMAAKTSLGATDPIGLAEMEGGIGGVVKWVAEQEKLYHRKISRLLGVRYPVES